jgi:hypothetical protein
MIDPRTGALILAKARIGFDLTRSSFLSTPMAKRSHCEDLRNGWMHVHLQPEVVGQVTWGIDLVFEAERLDGYRLALVDPKYGTSWDDWSEASNQQRSMCTRFAASCAPP